MTVALLVAAIDLNRHPMMWTHCKVPPREGLTFVGMAVR